MERLIIGMPIRIDEDLLDLPRRVDANVPHPGAMRLQFADMDSLEEWGVRLVNASSLEDVVPRPKT